MNHSSNTNKILVDGIPSSVTSDRLIIHFQKKKNVGGGDVDSVTYPLSKFEADKAVVEFEKTATADSVLRNQHDIGGKRISVRPFYSEVFANVTAKISTKAVTQLQNSFELDEEIDNIEECTGAVFKRQDNEYEIQGEWYQMKAALERVESMWDKTNQGVDTRQEMGDYMSRQSPTPTPSKRQSSKTSKATSPKQQRKQSNSKNTQHSENEFRVMDKDMFAFIEKVHAEEVKSILKKFNVSLKKDVVGDAVNVAVCKITPGASDTTKALKSLSDLYMKISTGIKDETLDVGKEFSSLTMSDIDDLIKNTIQPEFPQIFITRMIDSSLVLFLAESREHCKFAVEQFSYFAKALQHSNKKETEMRYKTQADKDVFNYALLVHAARMREIWKKHGAQISTTTEGDCTKIDVVPSGAGEFQPKAAISDFEKFINNLTTTIAQETGCVPDDVPKAKLDMAMTNCKEIFTCVLIAPMHDDPTEFIFLAEKKQDCKLAKNYFLGMITPQ